MAYRLCYGSSAEIISVLAVQNLDKRIFILVRVFAQHPKLIPLNFIRIYFHLVHSYHYKSCCDSTKYGGKPVDLNCLLMIINMFQHQHEGVTNSQSFLVLSENAKRASSQKRHMVIIVSFCRRIPHFIWSIYMVATFFFLFF